MFDMLSEMNVKVEASVLISSKYGVRAKIVAVRSDISEYIKLGKVYCKVRKYL